MSFSGYFPQNSKQFALFRAVFVTDECSTIGLHEDWKQNFPKVQKYNDIIISNLFTFLFENLCKLIYSVILCFSSNLN